MKNSPVQLAAVAASLLILAVAAFQVALALGLPLGDATFGGNAPHDDGVLSTGFRIVALVNAAILVLFAWIVLARAGLRKEVDGRNRALYWVTWGIVGFLILNTLGNLFATHPFERFGMSSVTMILVLLCGYVAYRSPTR